MTGQRRLVSLEAFIIDEVEHLDEQGAVISREEELIGGGGTYAMIGARMFLPPDRLGMFVSYTDESLPAAMRARLESYGPKMWFFKPRTDGDGTCRSIQTYQRGARREKLVDYLLYDPVDLIDSPFGDPLPTTIHLVSFIDRMTTILDQIRAMGADRQPAWTPRLVWEPYYSEAVPSNWSQYEKLVPEVAVFSPNHVEALKLCDMPEPGLDELRPAVERACIKMARLRPQLATIIRAGALGACYISSADPTTVHWTPAYWTSEHPEKIVDPTGAGNGFMGALSAALDEGLDLHQAVTWGTIAASFIIEQASLPHMSGDLWNGEAVQKRVQDLAQRVKG